MRRQHFAFKQLDNPKRELQSIERVSATARAKQANDPFVFTQIHKYSSRENWSNLTWNYSKNLIQNWQNQIFEKFRHELRVDKMVYFSTEMRNKWLELNFFEGIGKETWRRGSQMREMWRHVYHNQLAASFNFLLILTKSAKSNQKQIWW